MDRIVPEIKMSIELGTCVFSCCGMTYLLQAELFREKKTTQNK